MDYDFNNFMGNKNSDHMDDDLVYKQQDSKNEKNIAALESIFSSTGNSNNDFLEDSTNYIDNKFSDDFSKNFSDLNLDDPLEKTKDMNTLHIEQLKYLKELIDKQSDENDDFTNDDGNIAKSGHQKVLTTKPKSKYDGDVGQIVSSFIGCSVLAFVTAAMGVGFILNIVLQIK